MWTNVEIETPFLDVLETEKLFGYFLGVSLADPLLQCSDDKIVEHIVEDPFGLGFSCGLCGRGFGSEKGHCKRHIKNVHSKISSALSCDFCQKSYKNYDTLKAHQRASHGIYCNK